MILSYETYRNEQYSLTLEQMKELHAMMIAELSDEEAKDLYQDLVVKATKYTVFRSNWNLLTLNERAEENERRSSCHNTVIDQFNILARYTKKIGHTAEWRKLLGDIVLDDQYRKRIGDFACYIVFVNAINAR